MVSEINTTETQMPDTNGHTPSVRMGQQRRERRRVPEGETPEQRFSRLATNRTRRALWAIEALGNLAAPSYKFTEDQVEQIDTTIESAMEETRSAFMRRLHGGRKQSQRVAEFSV